MIKMITTYYKVLLNYTIFFLAFLSAINSQTNYYSTGNGEWDTDTKWTPGIPSETISAGDTVFVRHKMEISAVFEIIVNGVIVIESSGEMHGNKKIIVNSGATLINQGEINLIEEVLAYGSIYNSNSIDIKKIIIEGGYMCNTGALEINEGELIHIYGGTLECEGDLIADEIKIENNGGDVAVFGGGSICNEVGNDPIIDLRSGIIDSAFVEVCGLNLLLAKLLPTELYSYKVELEDNNVRIDWATDTEVDNDYFVVERSLDSINFEEVGRLQGAGNSEVLRYYAVTDRFPHEGISYYRLKQVDYDEKTTYFDIKLVDYKDNSTPKNSLTVFPNPVKGHSKFSIGFEGFEGNTVQLKIRNMNGFEIYSAEIDISQEHELIDLETNIIQNPGMYVVSVHNGIRWRQHVFISQ